MPCISNYDNEPRTPEQIFDRKTPAMLCAILRAIPPESHAAVLQAVDWTQAGVTRAEFDAWWTVHQERDAIMNGHK